MTTRTIYVPRLIESAEQAEALPGGTVAFHGSEAGRSTACRIPPIAADGWRRRGWKPRAAGLRRGWVGPQRG